VLPFSAIDFGEITSFVQELCFYKHYAV